MKSPRIRRATLPLWLLIGFLALPAYGTLSLAPLKKGCGHALSALSAISSLPFRRGGAAFDVAVQGLLNLNGMGNGPLYRRAIRRQLEGQNAVGYDWIEKAALGREVVLTPLDPENDLSRFIKKQNDQGITVAWGQLPAFTNAMYLPAHRRLYVSQLDIATLTPTHYSEHEADHGTLHALRRSGNYSGPIFTFLYEANGFRHGEAQVTVAEPTEELWTYPRAFQHLLNNDKLPFALKYQALREMFPGWNRILFDLQDRTDRLLKLSRNDLDAQIATRPAAKKIWGDLPLDWLGLSHKTLIAEIPTRFPYTSNPRRLYDDGYRRLQHLQKFVQQMRRRQMMFEADVAAADPKREAMLRERVAQMIALAETNFRDETDPVARQ